MLLPALGIATAHAAPAARNRPGFLEARTVVSQTVDIRGGRVDISGATVKTRTQRHAPIDRASMLVDLPTPIGSGKQVATSLVVKGGIARSRTTSIEFGPAGEVLARKTSRQTRATSDADHVSHIVTTNRVARDDDGSGARNVTLTETTVRTKER